MEPDLTIVLLGHTGVGKSASGNTILGEKAFESKRSLKSVTKEISTRTGKVCGRQISVIDTPGILCAGAEEQIKTCCQEVLQSSRPHLFLVVIKIDRFTEESKEAVDAAVRVIGDEGLKNSDLLFTHGDALEDPLEEFINDPDGPLPPIVERFGRRCHLFNNKDNDQQQVSELLEKKSPSHPLQSESAILEDRRIVLLGLPGTGKSSSGNTILGSKPFKSGCGFGSVTEESVSKSAEVEGRRVTVVDTPGFTDEGLSPQQLFTEIVKSIEEADPGPHAFLIVVRIGRITSADIALFKLLQKVFFRDALKHTMVLFTHGDLLKEESIEELIRAEIHVSELVSMFGGRYCVFNNEGQRDRQQVRKLLDKVDEMVAANGGQYWRFSTTQFQLDWTGLGSVPGTTFAITKRFLLNVGRVVIAMLRKTAVTLFYTRYKRIRNLVCGAISLLAAVCCFLSHTKQLNRAIWLSRCCRYLKMPGLILLIPVTTLLMSYLVSAWLAWNLGRAGTKKGPGTIPSGNSKKN